MNDMGASAMGKIAAVILECVPEEGVPDGHVYAALMKYLGLDGYQLIRGNLVKVGALKLSAHYLTRGESYEKCLRGLKAGE